MPVPTRNAHTRGSALTPVLTAGVVVLFLFMFRQDIGELIGKRTLDPLGVQLTIGLAWPFVTFVAVLLLRYEIKALLRALAGTIDRIRKIKFGEHELHVESVFEIAGSVEVRGIEEAP